MLAWHCCVVEGIEAVHVALHGLTIACSASAPRFIDILHVLGHCIVVHLPRSEKRKIHYIHTGLGQHDGGHGDQGGGVCNLCIRLVT